MKDKNMDYESEEYKLYKKQKEDIQRRKYETYEKRVREIWKEEFGVRFDNEQSN